ncbi:hypothetical protein [Achromobacter mucicolens]|uniref:hypothetical protein n=1 Tax=Achromobacter mucicolens TaxID=1389922 RepID=UPI003974AF4B
MNKRKQPPTGRKASPVSEKGTGLGDAQNVRQQIVNALNNGRYTARTIAGISKEAKLKSATVVEAIRTDDSLRSVVKVMPIRAKNGRVLLTTKERFQNEASLKTKFIDFFASRKVGIKDVE